MSKQDALKSLMSLGFNAGALDRHYIVHQKCGAGLGARAALLGVPRRCATSNAL